MSDKELTAEAVASAIGITKADAKLAVDAVFRSIADQLRQNQSYRVTGFGTFTVRERGERTARNPRTGEPITVAASKSVQFKPGSSLRSSV